MTGSSPSGAVDGSRLLRTVDLGMQFNDRWVLRDVNVAFSPGEVHGIVGHNGSGKSTLIKIMAGYHRPSAGAVLLHDQPIPQELLRGGAALSFVHQDLALVPEFTALENFGLGAGFDTRRGSIDWPAQRRRLQRVLDMFEASVPLDVPVRSLPMVSRALVAIGRAVAGGQGADENAKFLILDEPTTSLEGPEVDQLFAVVRQLAANDVGVVLVSHHLDDVREHCAKISVLRDGRLVDTVGSTSVSHDGLIDLMLGESAPLAHAIEAEAQDRPAPPQGPARLSIAGLQANRVRDVDLEVASGECICVLGLTGSGRDELIYAIAGSIQSHVDKVRINGTDVAPLRPRTLRKNRVALVPGNRMPGSLVRAFSVKENLTLASMPEFKKFGNRIDASKEKRTTVQWIERLDIRPGDAEHPTQTLSGGNKQKVILAKWLEIDPLIMLIDEPTAGVDVGAAARIFQELRALTARGMSMIVSTSDVSDALALADRVLIMNHGRITRELSRSLGNLTEVEILSAMSSAGSEIGTPGGTDE